MATNWGGKRAGAGRPKLEQPMRRITVYLTQLEADYLAELGGGNRSEGVSFLITLHGSKTTA